MKFWKTIIAVAAASAGLQTQAETLTIHYRDNGNNDKTLEVEEDVEVVKINSGLSSLTLPEGLTKLHTLDIPQFHGSRLKLPKDIGKEAEWPFRLKIRSASVPSLAVHREMEKFELFHWIRQDFTGDYDWDVPTRIPAAKDLIKNLRLDVAVDSEGFVRASLDSGLRIDVIEVYGFPPRISMTRKDGGVELSWDRGALQSAPTIDGPWKDVTFDQTVRRLFLRSSSPAEFFRVKPN